MIPITNSHRNFCTGTRSCTSTARSQSILSKSVFEHIISLENFSALLLTSKTFQNSSLGAKFLAEFIVDKTTIPLVASLLSPSSCNSLQFIRSLEIHNPEDCRELENCFVTFINQLVQTKYLHRSLRSLTLDHVTNGMVCSFFGSSSNLWPRLQSLDVSFCMSLDDSAMSLVAHSASNLSALSLRGSFNLSDSALQHISALKNITSLNLGGCSVITNFGLAHVAELVNLTSLDLSVMYCISSDGLEAIAAKLSNLTELSVHYCPGIFASGFEHVSRLPNLVSLNAKECDNLADDGLAHIGRCSLLKILDVSVCPKITDAGLQHIWSLASLTSLNLEGCDGVTDAGLDYISSCSELTSLNLSRCHFTDVALQEVSDLANLTKLDVSVCCDVTDAGLQLVGKLSNLRLLNLYHCDKITDAGLQHLSNLSNITHLNLRSCSRITDVGIQHLAKLNGITFLDLSGCPFVTDAGLLLVVSQFSSITTLLLYNCASITNAWKPQFTARMPNCEVGF